MAESVCVPMSEPGESPGGGEFTSVVLTMEAVGEKNEEVEDGRAVHSLLICPSQWSAFLESTPVSLVRRREEERAPTQSQDERYANLQPPTAS